jgi:hypothetical protein
MHSWYSIPECIILTYSSHWIMGIHETESQFIPRNYFFKLCPFIFFQRYEKLAWKYYSFVFLILRHDIMTSTEVKFFSFFVLCFQFCFLISEHRGECGCTSPFWSWNVCQQSWHELTECLANTEWRISLRSYVNNLSIIGSSERSILFSLKHWFHFVIIRRVNELFPYINISSIWIDWDSRLFRVKKWMIVLYSILFYSIIFYSIPF